MDGPLDGTPGPYNTRKRPNVEVFDTPRASRPAGPGRPKLLEMSSTEKRRLSTEQMNRPEVQSESRSTLSTNAIRNMKLEESRLYKQDHGLGKRSARVVEVVKIEYLPRRPRAAVNAQSARNHLNEEETAFLRDYIHKNAVSKSGSKYLGKLTKPTGRLKPTNFFPTSFCQNPLRNSLSTTPHLQISKSYSLPGLVIFWENPIQKSLIPRGFPFHLK